MVSFSSLFLSFLVRTRRDISTLFTSNKTKKPKNLPPSPPSLPIIGHLHHLKKPFHQFLARLSAQHGPILFLRFGIHPVLVVSSAALAEECFTTNDIAFANRPKFPTLRNLSRNYLSLATATYGPGWREMRRFSAVEALSGHRLAFFTDVRAEEARDLARRLLRDAKIGTFTRVELRPRLFGLAMNVIMRMMFGKRYYGEEDGDEEARRFKQIVGKVFSFANASNVGDFLPSAIGWLARLGVERKLAQIHRYMDRFLQDLLEERRRKTSLEEEGKTTNKTMIDAILSVQKDQPEQYSDTFIKSLFVSLLLAGTDTSSNTIEWAMCLLLNSSEKLTKARKEIDEKLGNDRLLEEFDLITYITYLHCIIKETLRLYPVVPLLLPHQSLEPCNVGGYDVSSETMLLVNAYAIQRDPAVWSEPTKFLPERFLEPIVGGGKMLPFGMGRRKCPGEGLALKELRLVLGILIQCFQWRRVGHEEVDLKEGVGLTMPKATPLQVLCMPRQNMLRVLSQL
ncbi:hypothetical protein KFK09_021269 [Dendrobium nobile]|uniref:Cytochrome P450 n=1 Tax=Dendrobium nobile TaxID=94219 RepID=A0A8T3APP4_DENNO|nr:hypothetical protein KFK09_021269 [Dendrobium nobile]